ncbi:MAG: hypothetical protein C5B54_11605, partial [Acidobacteria bacterium]
TNGNPTSNETLAESTTAGNTWANEAASNQVGQSVVVWRDDVGADTIRGRAFHADGTPVSGSEFIATSVHGTDNCFEPAVTMFSDGSFLVVWRETGGGGIIGQRFNADQTPATGPFPISSTPKAGLYNPSVSSSLDGHFVVCWRDSTDATNDIKARWFDSAGVPISGDFFGMADTAGEDSECGTAMDAAGNFLVTWRNQGGVPTIAVRYFSVGPPPTPISVTSLDAPTSGNRGDTLTIHINGSNFTSDLNCSVAPCNTVSFPDDAHIVVNSVTFVDAANIDANITIGAATFLGLHDVKVSELTGSATGNDLFTVIPPGGYPAPSGLSVLPNSGTQGSSLGITISGTNFANVPGQLSVNFGANITVSNVKFVSGSSITATLTISGSAVTGLRSFSVSNPGPQTGTCTNCFNVILNPILYSDDFSDGDASDWSHSSGTWSAASLALVGDGGIDISPFIGCAICSISADIKINTATGVITILGWYNDKKNTVMVKLNKDSNKWILKQRVNGVSVAKGSFPQTLSKNVLYHVAVAFDGNNFTLSINGSPVIVMPKGAGTNPSGLIGFKVKNAVGTIDNIQVFP